MEGIRRWQTEEEEEDRTQPSENGGVEAENDGVCVDGFGSEYEEEERIKGEGENGLGRWRV